MHDNTENARRVFNKFCGALDKCGISDQKDDEELSVSCRFKGNDIVIPATIDFLKDFGGRMRKRIVSLLTAALLICGILFGAATSVVFAESLYVRKIVSVVYDDSASMGGQDWAYANYAMQTFCGMMNSEDQLFITYMSGVLYNPLYKPYSADLSSGGIQGSVDSIRSHQDSGSTPYDAVETAMKKLEKTKDSNPNTQYWLVVITDGYFNEMNGMYEDQAVNMLDTNLADFTKKTMPNGTNPQVTFLSIGGGAVSPTEKTDKGIFTYHAEDAEGIMTTMSAMADRISGRTRLSSSDITQVNDTTIRVESAIPLLNIVMLLQQTDAKPVKTVMNNELSADVSREVRVSFPDYSNLHGGIFMIGDSAKTMPAGTYEITFDEKVNVDNLVILFEPALEIRMRAFVNGREITDYSELDNLSEGDEITISCRIYEMGTDNEIDSSLLPPDTSYRISIAEDGTVKAESTDSTMTIDKYKLGKSDTELTATISIPGFNPIRLNFEFTPAELDGNFTLSADYGGTAQSVRLNEIFSNKDLSIVFTIYEDGVQVTDPERIKKLNPVIDVSPAGNSGTIEYLNDGRIKFTPNNANVEPDAEGSMDVTVTCTLKTGAAASHMYTVVISDYKVIAIPQTESIIKTEFFGNQIGASFYITKDGQRLPKSEVDGKCSVTVDKRFKSIELSTSTEADGTIVCIPTENAAMDIGFSDWWIYWVKYLFKLPHGTMNIHLSSPWGEADSEIAIKDASLKFRLLNVYLPLLIETAAAATLTTWVILVATKPRFAKNAKLYVGDVIYINSSGLHRIHNFRPIVLKKYNKLKYRWKFKRGAEVIRASGVAFRAEYGNIISCEMIMPWYKCELKPDDYTVQVPDAASLKDYIERHRYIMVEELSMLTTVTDPSAKRLAASAGRYPRYWVIPTETSKINDVERIIRAKIILYTN